MPKCGESSNEEELDDRLVYSEDGRDEQFLADDGGNV